MKQLFSLPMLPVWKNFVKKMVLAEKFYQERVERNGPSKGLYRIGRGEKIAFMQSGQAEALLKEIDPKGRFDNKLSCRLRAQYKKGPATTQLVAITALIAATVATDGMAAITAPAMPIGRYSRSNQSRDRNQLSGGLVPSLY